MCTNDLTVTRRRALSIGAAGLVMPMLSRRISAAPPGSQGTLVIRPRNEWGADLPPVAALQSEPDVRFLLVHHTAGRTEYDERAVAEQIREVYRFHTSPEKGWPDVCYNFFIDRFGGVWEGRLGSLSGPVMADATGGSQGFAQLVCLLGNFHENAPTAEMLDALQLLLAHLAKRYALDTTPGVATSFVSRGSNRWPVGTTVTATIIAGHRDMSATVCPGDFVYPLLEGPISEAVHRLVTSETHGTPTTTTQQTPPPPTTATADTTAPPTGGSPTTTLPTSTSTAERTQSSADDPANSGRPGTGVGKGAVAETNPDIGQDDDGTNVLVAGVAVMSSVIAAGALVFGVARRGPASRSRPDETNQPSQP